MEKRKNKQANKQIENKMRQVRGGWEGEWVFYVRELK
jgi:hypothetical protein